MKPPRCDYCQREAIMWFRWQSSYSRMGCRKSMILKCGACDEHKNCANFLSMRSIHPDVPMHTARR